MFLNKNNNLISLLLSMILILNSIGLVKDVFCRSDSDTGTLKGKITNAEGIALDGAYITIPSLERGTTSNEEGEYILEDLPSGKFLVAVKYIGYGPQTKTIEIQINQIINIDFTLEETVIESEPIVVTGNPMASDPLTSPLDVSNISGRNKIRLQSTSLGKTVESIPGVFSISTGSVVGKPVIRGNTGERIRILNDGIAQEYQQYGERHAPTIDPFNYEKIEVMKGSACLLYGSDALGGAINLIPRRFSFASDVKTIFNGSVISSFNTNNREFMGGLCIGNTFRYFGYKLSFIHRNAGNFHTPDIEPYSVTNKRGDPKFTGEIDYTDLEQYTGTLSLGYLSDIGIFTTNYNHYFSENNFLLPTGEPIGLRLINQIATLKGVMPFGNFIVKPIFSYQRNHRQATKNGSSRDVLPDSANVDLILNVYTGRFEIENIDIFNLSGTFGGEIKYYDHKNIGLVPLQPSGHFVNLALFIFEEHKINKWTLDAGARFDYKTQKFFGSATNPLLLEDDKRNYSSLSGALGVSYKITDYLAATANISRGFRTPSFYNLYVYGYHGGVFAFQIGEPSLGNETTLELSSSLRFRTSKVKASANAFWNTINNYIFLYNAPDHPLAPPDSVASFVFAHAQDDARLYGLDLSVEAQVLKWLVFNGSYSLIKSEFLSGPYKDNGLPLMPANRLNAGLKFLLPDISIIQNPYFLFDIKYVSDKSAAGVYEPFGQFDDGIGPDIPFGVASTKNYTLFNLGLGFDLRLYREPVNIDIEINNLFNTVYRDFLDTYKGYTLAPGFGFIFKFNIPFGN